MSKETTIRIVPPDPSEGGWVRSQGTKVVTEDGQEIKGVTKIVLTAQIDDLWRARLWINPSMVEMEGITATWEPTPKPSWWRKLLNRFLSKEVDLTMLSSTSRHYRKEW